MSLRIAKWRRDYPDKWQAEKARYYERLGGGALNRRKWTDDDIQRLFDASLTDRELSALLGRGVRAIQVSRVRFKHLRPTQWKGKGTHKVHRIGKHPAAVALGRLGGLKGGPARAKAMTPAQRRDSARNAVNARWAKHRLKQKTNPATQSTPSPEGRG